MEQIDLQGFDDFIKERGIIPDRNRPWCVKWVERFLQSACWQRRDLSDEDRLRLFVDSLSRGGRCSGWQINQAEKSVRLYLFVYHSENRRPETLRSYLSFLAMQKKVAASTQNQAFNALLFLFREVWKTDIGDLRFRSCWDTPKCFAR